MNSKRNSLSAMPKCFSYNQCHGTMETTTEKVTEAKGVFPHEPKAELTPGEMNRVKLVSKNKKPVKVYNRFVRGMCGTVTIDLDNEGNGITWDRPRQIIVTIRNPSSSCKPKTVNLDLCKLIATNREVFGSDWTQCPFTVAGEHYSKRGRKYWENALKHCYWLASNAKKDVCMAARLMQDSELKL